MNVRIACLVAAFGLVPVLVACGSSDASAPAASGGGSDAGGGNAGGSTNTAGAPAGGSANVAGSAGTTAGGSAGADVGGGGAGGAPVTAVACAAYPNASSCVYFTAGKDTESDIKSAIVASSAGAVFLFSPGTFAFTDEIDVTAANSTLRGSGLDVTIFDFTNQTKGSEGLLAQPDNGGAFTLADLTVLNPKGDGVKVKGGTNVQFLRVHSEYNTDPPTARGGYALYPVQCQYVLIEDCVAEGASDSGIYVGQSQDIVVHHNRAQGNVSGIEIENSFRADVYENTSTNNTGGILVFDLPDLPQEGGHDVRVYNNTITANNGANFAPMGDIVGQVPAGMGMLVMANTNVEIFGNTFQDNNTTNLGVASYAVTLLATMDTKYYQYPSKVHIHDNTFTGGGTMPDQTIPIGAELQANLSSFPNNAVPDVIYDGNVDPMVMGTAPNTMQICIHDNGTGTFGNLDFPSLTTISTDATPYACTLPAIAPVVLPGQP